MTFNGLPVEEGDTVLEVVVEWGFPHDAHFEKAAVAFLTLQNSPQLVN